MKYPSFFQRTVLTSLSALIFLLTFAPVVQAKEIGASPGPVVLAAHLYQQSQPGFMLPIRLVIPSIHVDVPADSLGLTPERAVAAPAGPANVAWFNQGPRPGQKGSAVIVGHYGWKGGIRAAFDTLHTVQVGDKIYVQDAISGVSVFVVTGKRIYGANAQAPNVFASSSGTHLNLITCSGKWDASVHSYTQRLVVFTELVS